MRYARVVAASVADLIAPLHPGARLAGRFIVLSVDEERASVTIARGKGGEQTVVVLRPRDDARPSFAKTRSLDVSYVGRPGSSLPGDALAALGALVDVIGGNDRGEPLAARVGASLPLAPPHVREVAVVRDGHAYLRLDSTCEMSCVFCTRGEGGSLPKPRPLSPRSEVETDLDRVIAGGARAITFGGDEPLTHPDIEAFITRAVAAGVREVQLVTSGNRLVERAFVARLKRLGVTRVELPIYGPSAEVHDGVTRLPGSFDALLQATRNLVAVGLPFGLHSVLLRANLAHAGALRAFVRTELGLPDIGLSHVMPRSDDVGDYRDKMPTYAEIERVLGGTGASVQYFPLCVARRIRGEHVPASGDAGFDARGRVKPAATCAGCRLADACPGTFELYVAAYGTSGLGL